MLKVGIDRISFYTSHHYLELSLLARARGIDPDKFLIGLGQETMGVSSPDEDIVTLAAHAAERILNDENLHAIDTLIFATETGIDQSKAAGVYIQGLLNLPKKMRVIEVKQACYSATAALQLATSWVTSHPDKKVLILSADIARYGFNTAGESSQGTGSVAMLISANPRILAIEPGAGLYTEDVMDFWRPNYRDEALVDGHYSTQIYLHALTESWKHYQDITGRKLEDHTHICYHTPVPRLVEKAHAELYKLHHIEKSREEIALKMKSALKYGRLCGNAYSAALYISLASLLDNDIQDLSGKRIGFYSYGSGCVAEFFSGLVQPHYRDHLDTEFHASMLASRKALSHEEYEAFYSFKLPQNGGECHTPKHHPMRFRLNGMKDHKRQYEKMLPEAKIISSSPCSARSPGKLILSGEHAVVYGKPALAIAINRYAETSIKAQDAENVSLNLTNFNYSGSHTLSTLREMKHRVKAKYKQFLQGKARIRDVLQTPFELTQYALASLLDEKQHQKGLTVHTHSSIPVGCGMGSSAASVLSVLRALAHFHDINLSSEDYLRLALETENLQHGKTNGLDLHISLFGGCVYFQNGRLEKRPLPQVPLYLINTGTPSTTTGECVSHVREHFGQSTIWDTFASVTHIMDQAFLAHDSAEVEAAVRDNHELLVKIGVVPDKVQRFIQELNAVCISAKICGAGAVQGDQAGAVLAIGKNKEALEAICRRYHYDLSPVEAANMGLHIA